MTFIILTDESRKFNTWNQTKGVIMRLRSLMFTMVIATVLLYCVAGMASGTVNFPPVRAPSLGPDNAPVTIIEIADYM